MAGYFRLTCPMLFKMISGLPRYSLISPVRSTTWPERAVMEGNLTAWSLKMTPVNGASRPEPPRSMKMVPPFGDIYRCRAFNRRFLPEVGCDLLRRQRCRLGKTWRCKQKDADNECPHGILVRDINRSDLSRLPQKAFASTAILLYKVPEQD